MAEIRIETPTERAVITEDGRIVHVGEGTGVALEAKAERQLERLLEAIDAHRAHWEGARPVRNPTLETIFDQDDALYRLADSIRGRNG